ncbi:Arginase/deacetylase [Parathielavia appendiculata]|uniref:Arginase/deacetylase n=1 Tax=Parathielavia appendiculata TaxID=2587402 RepID=A0AAN6U1N8_9PEZI|nr:Arginase/deacetylase [Parathielavia appendiculata]
MSFAATPLTSVTIISAPYHVGLRASPIHRSRVSEGPEYIKSAGLLSRLRDSGVTVHEVEIPPVADDFEGEIGRTFEILRRLSRAVTAARNQSSFPIVLAGNCCASVGVAAGLWGSNDLTEAKDDALGCVWFDAHDDYNIPDSVVSGYFDSQGIAMMAGECWKALLDTIPGFRPILLRNVVHCGMRDVNDLERARVEASDMGVVWGGERKSADFADGLKNELLERFAGDNYTATLLHVDIDVLDGTVGKANQFATPPGGLLKKDMEGCIRAIWEWTIPLALPVALTIASFDPLCDGEDSARRLAGIAIDVAERVLDGLKARGYLKP